MGWLATAGFIVVLVCTQVLRRSNQARRFEERGIAPPSTYPRHSTAQHVSLPNDVFSRIVLGLMALPSFVVSALVIPLMFMTERPSKRPEATFTLLAMEFVVAVFVITGIAIVWCVARPRWGRMALSEACRQNRPRVWRDVHHRLGIPRHARMMRTRASLLDRYLIQNHGHLSISLS
jgi:hypothetical protein